MDPIKKAEELTLKLTKAIEVRDKETALQCVQSLIEDQAHVAVQVKEEMYPKHKIRLSVGVEDAESTTIPVTLEVHPYMTISSLKDLVFRDYGFHPRVQKWIIGQRLPKDNETLHYHGIRRNGDMAFLYLISAKQANLSKQNYDREMRQRLLEEYGYEIFIEPRGTEHPAKQDDGEIQQFIEGPPAVPKKPKPPALPPELPELQVGWTCPGCTYVNKPTRPGCEICCTDRPENYKVPNNYIPDEEENAWINKEAYALEEYQKLQAAENYAVLVQSMLEDVTDQADQAANKLDKKDEE